MSLIIHSFSLITLANIWQYHTSKYLTIFIDDRVMLGYYDIYDKVPSLTVDK